MFDFDDTEAAHLSEIYDGEETESWTPFKTSTKKAYVKKNESNFKKEDGEKFVITQRPKHKKETVNILYLCDRSKTKRYWWSTSAFLAMKFDDKEAAEEQRKKYKFGDIKIEKIKDLLNNAKK